MDKTVSAKQPDPPLGHSPGVRRSLHSTPWERLLKWEPLPGGMWTRPAASVSTRCAVWPASFPPPTLLASLRHTNLVTDAHRQPPGRQYVCSLEHLHADVASRATWGMVLWSWSLQSRGSSAAGVRSGRSRCVVNRALLLGIQDPTPLKQILRFRNGWRVLRHTTFNGLQMTCFKVSNTELCQLRKGERETHGELACRAP